MLTWYIEFDWDNDGAFDDEIFSLTTGLNVRRGRQAAFQEGRGFVRQPVGELTLQVDNTDGRFDPFNAASPIYPNCLPGRECRVTVNDGTVTYPVFRGRVSDISPVGDDASKTVAIKIQDGWVRLKNEINYSVVAGERTGSLIGRVLDQAGYIFSDGGLISVWRFPTRIGETSFFGPPTWTRSLQNGNNTVDYWWLRDTRADDAINDLVESEFGLFWFGADGRAMFLSRGDMYNQPSAAVLPQSTFLKTLATRQSAKNIRNIVRIKSYPKVLQAESVLWKLAQKPLIAAGKTVVYWPELKFENRKVAAQALVSPIATIDYTANSIADGSGINLTGNLNISVTPLSEFAELSIENAGVTAAYITFLQLRGDAIDTPDIALGESVDDDSIFQFEPRLLLLDLKWQDDPLIAQDFSEYLISWLPAAQAFPLVEIETRPDVQFAYDLCERLTLQLNALGGDQDFRIGGLAHDWIAETGQGVKTTWYMEPVNYALGAWVFPTQMGVSSRFAF